MLRVRSVLFAVTSGVLVYYGAFRLFHAAVVHAQAKPRLAMLETRTANSDIEVRGLTKDAPRFVTRESLELLPQVDAVLKRDVNFPEIPEDGLKVRGVRLEVLKEALGAGPEMSVEGICSDDYTAPFPVEYVKQHHPIVVLTIEGMEPKAWAAKSHSSDLGPYFVTYNNYVPAFRVLSHEDREQVPVQMVRLEFAPEKQMFAGIKPHATAGTQAKQGYMIAQQNCFRCHSAGAYGGTKSGVDWKTLGKDARERPDWFASWVHDPKSLDAKTEMPANPTYDQATLTALTKYFSTMK